MRISLCWHGDLIVLCKNFAIVEDYLYEHHISEEKEMEDNSDKGPQNKVST